MKKEIQCKLTGTTGPGIKAHIIPKSFYDLGKDRHEPATLIHLNGESSFMKTSQVGEYDCGIVTKEGESYFHLYDSYAYDCLVRRGQEAKLYHDGKNPLCFEIIDFSYPKLKLFFLSLLWRAGVSSRQLFRNVRLGVHESRLRDQILNHDPGNPEEYAVVLGVHIDTPDYGFPFIEPQIHADEETGAEYYKFGLSRLVAHIKVDEKPFSSCLDDFVISPDLPLRYVVLGEFTKTSYYSQMADQVRAMRDQD